MQPYHDLSHLSLRESVDVDAIRARLAAMSDAELIAFGKQMRGLVYPVSYGGDGKPTVSAFSVQLSEARAEWRRRHPKSSTAESSYPRLSSV
jgi:hypothetical protein